MKEDDNIPCYWNDFIKPFCNTTRQLKYSLNFIESKTEGKEGRKGTWSPEKIRDGRREGREIAWSFPSFELKVVLCVLGCGNLLPYAAVRLRTYSYVKSANPLRDAHVRNGITVHVGHLPTGPYRPIEQVLLQAECKPRLFRKNYFVLYSNARDLSNKSLMWSTFCNFVNYWEFSITCQWKIPRSLQEKTHKQFIVSLRQLSEDDAAASKWRQKSMSELGFRLDLVIFSLKFLKQVFRG